jgi:DNA-binding LacI/PurR family transcriptional regulator
VYDVLLADIRSRVDGGDLAPTQLLPSEKVLARNHSISRWAVREALNVLEGEGLIERIPGRGTIVAGPRVDRRVQVKTLAVVVDVTVESRQNSYALELLQCLRSANLKLSRPFSLSWHFHDFSEDENYLDHLPDDLVAVMPFSHKCQSQLEQRRGDGPPRVICLARELVNDAIPQVYVDHKLGVKWATEYLLTLGHQRILMVMPPSYPGGHSDVRHKAFVKVMQEAGLAACSVLTGHYPGQRDVHGLVAEKLASPSAPTAIFVAAGSLTGPTMYALMRMGKRIPEDLSVVAYDDLPELRAFTPPLTAVRQPLGELADVLLRTLENYIETGRLMNVRTAIRPELVVRESCRGRTDKRIPDLDVQATQEKQ